MWAAEPFPETWLNAVASADFGWPVFLFSGQALLTAGWLRLLSLAGWAWWSGPAGEPLYESGSRGRPPTGPARLVARTAFVGLSLACLLPLADFYWALLPPDVAIRELPDPNGYDELVQAGNLINWTSTSNVDLDTLNASQCEQVLQDNRAAFELVRRALEKPSQVTDEVLMLEWDPYAGFRDLAYALWVEARAARLTGKTDKR